MLSHVSVKWAIFSTIGVLINVPLILRGGDCRMICWWTRRWTVNEEGGLAGEVPVAEHCECSGGGTKARLLQEARGLLLGWADRISFVNGWPEENNSRRNSKRLRIHPLFLTSICSTSYQSINTKHFCTAYTTAVIVALFMFVSQQSKALLWDCPLHLYLHVSDIELLVMTKYQESCCILSRKISLLKVQNFEMVFREMVVLICSHL